MKIEMNGKRIKVTAGDQTIVEGIAEVHSDDSGSDVLIRILEEDSNIELGTVLVRDGITSADIY